DTWRVNCRIILTVVLSTQLPRTRMSMAVPVLSSVLANYCMFMTRGLVKVHRAFCSIAFDVVATTNFDFLLETQYDASRRYCRPVIEEDHLSVNTRDAGTLLLKFHGDLHHPGRLVATEEDYDAFLDRYPLLATFISNLLITRTAVLIGYS